MGHVDIYHSRRANYTECNYWVRDERDAIGTPEQWIMKHQTSGTFWAKPITPKSNQQNQVSGVWMLDRNMLTIETDDHVTDITRGCLILYRGHVYMVESVQYHIHLKESEFNQEEECKTIINMRR